MSNVREWLFVPRAAWEAGKSFFANEGPLTAAALSYFALFSLFPLALVLLAVLAMFFPDLLTREWLIEQAETYLPGSETLVRENLARLMQVGSQLGLAGLVALLWSASAVFAVLSRALEKTLGERGKRSVVQVRLIGILMVLCAAVLLMVSLIGATLFQIMEERGWAIQLPELATLQWLSSSFGLVLLFFTIILAYRLIPTGAPALHDLWPGALVATLGLGIAREVFVRYVTTLDQHQLIYGPVAAIIVVLLWFYVSASIFLLGAEFVAALRRLRGNAQ